MPIGGWASQSRECSTKPTDFILGSLQFFPQLLYDTRHVYHEFPPRLKIIAERTSLGSRRQCLKSDDVETRTGPAVLIWSVVVPVNCVGELRVVALISCAGGVVDDLLRQSYSFAIQLAQKKAQ